MIVTRPFFRSISAYGINMLYILYMTSFPGELVQDINPAMKDLLA